MPDSAPPARLLPPPCLPAAEGMRQVAKFAAGAAGAALGVAVGQSLKAKRQSAAIIELANLLVALGDPSQLTREHVAAIEAKYGIRLPTACADEVQLIYGTLVEAAIPPGTQARGGRARVRTQAGASGGPATRGGVPKVPASLALPCAAGDVALRGDEQLLIQGFKAALGLTDVEAAPVHLDVGRRVLRGRLEAGSRSEDMEARKTFQKLIYVSTLTFGERQAAFLLPWSRVFGLTDAQVGSAGARP